MLGYIDGRVIAAVPSCTANWLPLAEVHGRDVEQNWGEETPEEWWRFRRADGLERWEREALLRFESDRADVLRRVQGLDRAVADVRRLLAVTQSRAWYAVLATLGAIAWLTARRISGVEVDEQDAAAALRVRRETPFGGFKDVLLAAASSAVLGLSDGGAKPRYGGVEGSAPRSLGAVERRLDAQLACMHAGVSEADLRLLAAADVGAERRRRARRTKQGDVEPAVDRFTPAELAAASGESEKFIRSRLRRARRLLGIALEERGLAPGPRRARGRLIPSEPDRDLFRTPIAPVYPSRRGGGVA